jgi:pyrroline-5-carboxylate reductase
LKKARYKVAFLGGGNMGSALLEAALRKKVVKPSEVILFDADLAKLKKVAARLALAKAPNALNAAQQAENVFICVKPQQAAELFKTISPAADGRRLFISVMAGVSTEALQAALPGPVVRVMPNTPALIGRGMSAVVGGVKAKAQHVRWVKKFLLACGQVVEVPESLFDAVTAVSGSGPAYVFYLAESLELAALKLKVPSAVARQLALQTIAGAAQMLLGKEDAISLRQKVTSPGGTTLAAISHLEAKNWQTVFVNAVQLAAARSAELGRR